MAMRHLRRALQLTSASWHCSQHAIALAGSEVLAPSTCFPPQSASNSAVSSPAFPLTALQCFTRHFSTAYSASAPRSKLHEPTNVYEYNKLIAAINAKKRANLVRDVYEDMLLDGVQPSAETFVLLIDGCMKGSRLQDVMYFFEEMKAMGYIPDILLYNSVIAACGRTMQVDKAFQIVQEMEASGIQPRHRIYLALLRTCAIAGRVDEAYGVVRNMAAKGLSLDKSFYAALIIAHKNKKPRTEEAIQKIFELLEQSKQQSDDDIMAMAATGEFEVTDDIDDGLATMLADDIQPRRGFINRRLTVYHAAVKALSSFGNKEGVKTVLKLVEMDGHEPDSYCVIQHIKCYLAENDFEQACAEYSKYVDTGRQPTLELYIVMIEGAIEQCTPQSSALAQKLLADLVKKGYFLNAQLGSQILHRACLPKTRDIAVANLVWDLMKNREVKVSKFIVHEYYRALERSNIPKDDPRLIGVKALVDEGRRVDFKKQEADPNQTLASDKIHSGQVSSEQMSVPGETEPSEQVAMNGDTEPSEQVAMPEHTASSEQASGHTEFVETPTDQFNANPRDTVLADEEAPIETPISSAETESLSHEPVAAASNEK